MRNECIVRGWILLAAGSLLSGQTFDVASVKRSARALGRDANAPLTFTATGVSGRNVTLKRLMVEAYSLQPYQFSGPKWLEDDELDLEAKTERPSSRDELRRMLQTLLADRFKLAAHRETKELRVYDLVIDKGGPKMHAAEMGRTLQQLANLISIQLSIPVMDDPTKPGIASNAAIPVIDKTGLAGTYDIQIEVKPELGVDPFTLWQRYLQDRLGLKLENRKSPVDLLVVDRVERIPTAN